MQGVYYMELYQVSYKQRRKSCQTIWFIHQTCKNSQRYRKTFEDVGEECGDINEVHSISHFVGVMSPHKSLLFQFQKERTLSHNLLRYTLPYKKISYRPPMA